MKKSTKFPDCGVEQENICFNGVSVGILVDKMENEKKEKI